MNILSNYKIPEGYHIVGGRKFTETSDASKLDDLYWNNTKHSWESINKKIAGVDVSYFHCLIRKIKE